MDPVMTLSPIAIFAALDDEIRIIRSKLIIDEQVHFKSALFVRGQYHKKPLILVRSGVGRKAMSTAVDYCHENFHPSACINVGYAGGTTPFTNSGDLIVASSVTDSASRSTLDCDDPLVGGAEKLSQQQGFKSVRGRIVTVDKVVSSPHDKAFIGTEHDAIAIDMESFAFVKRCQATALPCVVVRAILDPLDVILPDMGDVIDRDGQIAYSRLAGHLFRHPRDTLSLHRLEYCALKAREMIASFIDAWTAQ